MAGGPRFTHLDDGPWQEVRRQQHGDHQASVRERWLEFSPRYLSLYARWDPGMIVHAHGHHSDHVVFVVEGDMTCGDVHCPAGTHLALDRGDTFGPFVAGPHGVDAVRGDDGRPAVVPGRPGRLRGDARAARGAPAREPADRHAGVDPGHAELTMGAPFAAGSVSLRLYPHQDLDARGTVAELTRPGDARRRARLRRRHDQRAPRRLRRLPAQPAPGRRVVPRGDAARLGRGLPAAPAAAPHGARRRGGRPGSRPASPAGSGSASPPARCRPTSRSWASTMTDLAARFTAGLETVAATLRGDGPGILAGDAALADCRDTPIPVLERGDGTDRGAPRGRASGSASSSTPSRSRTAAAASPTRTATRAARAPAS